MAKRKIYRGRGRDEIYNYLSKHGDQLGSITRANGDHVADIALSIVGDDVRLEVDGVEYSSITDALKVRYDDFAVHDADGSEGSGDVANNIIGNYAILRHVMIGSVSLEDIVGPSESAKNDRGARAKKPKPAIKVAVTDKTVSAAGNLYDFFDRDHVVSIARAHGGAEGFQRVIQGMSVQQFAERFGVPFKAAA